MYIRASGLNLIHSIHFSNRFFLWEGSRGAAALGRLEKPHDKQQSPIILLVPHQDGAAPRWRYSDSTWSLDDLSLIKSKCKFGKTSVAVACEPDCPVLRQLFLSRSFRFVDLLQKRIAGCLRSMEKSLAIFQPGKDWKTIFWSVSTEKGTNFPDLIFRSCILTIFSSATFGKIDTIFLSKTFVKEKLFQKLLLSL